MTTELSALDDFSSHAPLAVATVPKISASKEQIEASLRRNREKDAENFVLTQQILGKCRTDADQSKDVTKKFHSLTAEWTEVGKFNAREKVRELEYRMNLLRGSIDNDDWSIFARFSELNDPDFWHEVTKYGCQLNKDQYYSDFWGMDARTIAKFNDYLRFREEVHKLKEFQ